MQRGEGKGSRGGGRGKVENEMGGRGKESLS